MQTAIIVALLASLQVVALWRRPDRVTWTVVSCFALAVIATANLEIDQRIIVTGFLDFALVHLLIGRWASVIDRRAATIAWIGLGKLVARLIYEGNPYMDHWTFAATMNCAFAAQVIVAGGLADGIGRWITDIGRTVRARRAGLIRNGEVR